MATPESKSEKICPKCKRHISADGWCGHCARKRVILMLFGLLLACPCLGFSACASTIRGASSSRGWLEDLAVVAFLVVGTVLFLGGPIAGYGWWVHRPGQVDPAEYRDYVDPSTPTCPKCGYRMLMGEPCDECRRRVEARVSLWLIVIAPLTTFGSYLFLTMFGYSEYAKYSTMITTLLVMALLSSVAGVLYLFAVSIRRWWRFRK